MCHQSLSSTIVNKQVIVFSMLPSATAVYPSGTTGLIQLSTNRSSINSVILNGDEDGEWRAGHWAGATWGGQPKVGQVGITSTEKRERM